MGDFIISDLHIPYEDERALNILYRIQYSLRPKNVIINGDFFDFPKISRFSTDPMDKENFEDSMHIGVEIIKRLQRYSNITFIEGNHDLRLRKAIWHDMPYLAGKITLEKLVNDELDNPIKFVRASDREAMLWWDDNILIGHFNKCMMHSAYTAKNLCDKYKCSIVQAHTHRQGQYMNRTYKNTIIGVEGGCFCDMNPQYVAHPDWQQGFCIYQRRCESINIELVHIENGSCVFRGKLIRGKDVS